MSIAVECKGLRKVFGEKEAAVEALRGVNMIAKTNELLMIVGPSGSGKTTLLSILSGILQPTEGECFIFGEEIGRMSEAEKTLFRKKNIGFIFQSFNLIPHLTARENVSIPLILNGINEEEARERAGELLQQLGLGKRTEALPTHMSGGEQQRVAICRGCIHNPRLIVCDEPTSALDSESGHEAMKLFKMISVEQGRVLLVVTHDSRIFSFADRIIRMEDGAIQTDNIKLD